jgi:hypothetical protein
MEQPHHACRWLEKEHAMTATTKAVDTARQNASWARAIWIGLVGGVIAALVMAAFAMIAAATYQATGFSTPLYHIGSAFGSGDAAAAMETSMERAATDSYYFTAGPAVLGVEIHLVTGALWGVLFGMLARALRVTRPVVVAAGVSFGFAVMLVMAFVGLPAVASVFDSGPPIRDMASMVGWGTFTVEHVIYGLVLGLAGLALALRWSTGERAQRSDRDRPAREHLEAA